MKLQSFTIDGFKNLSNVRIELDNISALVSLNNLGKSNVLNAIAFGLNFIKAGPETKETWMANSDLMPINKYQGRRNFKFEMEFLTDFMGSEYQISYSYGFTWKYGPEVDSVIIFESLKGRPNNAGSKFTQYIIRSDDKASYKSSETGRCSSNVKIGDTELIINKLLAYDSLFYLNIVKDINSVKFYMEANFDARNFYLPDPIIRKGLEDISLDADNLPRVIYQLQENYPDKFELLKNIFRDLFPDVKDIIVKQHILKIEDSPDFHEDCPFSFSNSIYTLHVIDINLMAPIDFLNMSDGAKRVFLILTRIILANILNVSLIAIEEPENSIHPSLFQAFLQIMSQLLGDCKVIITSHSPYILSYLDPASVYVGINRLPGVAEFFAFKKSGQRMLQKESVENDMSLGDCLFSMLSDRDTDWSEYLEYTDHA